LALTGALPLDIQDFSRKAGVEAFGNIGPNGDAIFSLRVKIPCLTAAAMNHQLVKGL